MSLGAIAAAAGGAVGGSLLNLGGSVANSAMGWYFSKKAAALNYKYQQKLAENRPTWNRVGLEKAGLNPILAANSGAGAGGAGLNVQTPIVGDSKLGSSALEGASAIAGIASAFAQKDKTKQETKLAEASTRGQVLDNANKARTSGLIEAQTAKENAQTKYFERLSNKTWNEDYSLQLDNIAKAAKTAGFQRFIAENPDAIKDALAGEYGARAQALAKEVSVIAENWSKTASNAMDVIPVKKILSSLVNIIGKNKK